MSTSLERLEAALAHEGALGPGLGAADVARLRAGGLLPVEEWAARLQRQTEAACHRALERLCGSAPADVAADEAAGAAAPAAQVARGGRGADAAADAAGDALLSLDEARGTSEREWSARRAAYAAAQVRTSLTRALTRTLTRTRARTRARARTRTRTRRRT